MEENKFSEYWNQAQFCYFKAEVARGPASKHLWIHLAKDWMALAEPLLPQSDQQTKDRPEKQREPFVAA